VDEAKAHAGCAESEDCCKQGRMGEVTG